MKSVRQSPPVWHNLDNWGKMAPNHQHNELQLIKRGSWQLYDPSSLLPSQQLFETLSSRGQGPVTLKTESFDGQILDLR